jgi:hypothetical protein
MKETTWKSSVYSKRISVLLIGVLLLVSLFLGGYHYYRKTPSSNTYGSVSLAALLSLPDLNLEPTQATINDLLASLSLNLSQVEYLEQIQNALFPSEKALDALSKNGFVVITNLHESTMEDAYCNVFLRDLPVLITTDSILHLYHLIFDNLLKDVEKEHLIPMVRQMTSRLLQKSLEAYVSTSSAQLKAASKEVLMYFSVAAFLIDSNVSLPLPVHDEAEIIVEKILEAKKVEPYPGEDYTQYKPRGHYENDAELEAYFRCMTWLSRRTFDLSKDDSLLQATLSTYYLYSMEDALTLWKTAYQVTSLFVGLADSVTPLSLHNATVAVFGESFQPDVFEDSHSIQRLKTELEKPQYTISKILSSVVYLDLHSKPIEYPKIFQFMGQRFVPDSYILQSVTYDQVPPYNESVRLLGSGLDVAAVLGSERAMENLEPEIQKYNYQDNLDKLTKEFTELPKESWESSLYFSWLYVLRPLVTTIPDERYPSFMQTIAWQDEKLNTMLSSWAQLRHDTTLYAKQPYSIGIACEIPTGYVEPYPEFYRGMQTLCLETSRFLREIHVLPPNSETVLNDMANITQTLCGISEKELNGTSLTEGEISFIRNVAIEENSGFCGVPPKKLGWYPSLVQKANLTDSSVQCIADVMTASGDLRPGGQPPQVLHAATGYVNFIIVVYETPEGNKTAAVGPVFSYYEFPMPGFQRLSDPEWKDMLQFGSPDGSPAPNQPNWTDTFTVRPK